MKKFASLFLCFLAITACGHLQSTAGQNAPAEAVLSGVVTEGDSKSPAEGAFIYVYRESNTHFFGPPNYQSSATDAQGRYSLQLPPGSYYVFSRKRLGGGWGPLHKDDYFSQPFSGLIRIQSGTTTVNLTLQKLEGQQFYRPEKYGTKTSTAISGRILDSQGKPATGKFAFAYRDQFRKQLPPDYGSLPADAEGRYVLYLDRGGSFVLGARSRAKEPPSKGDLLGFYKDRETPLTVETGSTAENIDITIIPFTGSPDYRPISIP